MKIPILLCVAAMASSPAIHAATTKAGSQNAAPTGSEKLNAEARLEVARKELKEMQAQFTEEHPRVKAQRKKIADLQREVRIEEFSRVLEEAKQDLARLRAQYGDSHPEVKAKLAEVALVEKRLEQEKASK